MMLVVICASSPPIRVPSLVKVPEVHDVKIPSESGYLYVQTSHQHLNSVPSLLDFVVPATTICGIDQVGDAVCTYTASDPSSEPIKVVHQLSLDVSQCPVLTQNETQVPIEAR